MTVSDITNKFLSWRIKERKAKFHKASIRKFHLKTTYGITPEEYGRLLKEQNHSCKICGIKEKFTRQKYFHVDHDHTTGKIRGLLCGRCNLGLGYFRESKDILLKAIQYITGE